MPRLETELEEFVNPKKNTLKGTLGLSTNVVNVTNRPGSVWVKLLDNFNEIVQARNFKVSPLYGLPVLMSYDGIKYTVEAVDFDRYATWPTPSSYLPNHASQHSAMRGMEGPDIVWVDSQQFLPLLSVPNGVTGALNVTIYPYNYRNSNGDLMVVGGTGTGDFLPLSTTGSTLYLLMLDDDTGNFYAITGSYIGNGVTGTADILSAIPKPPAYSPDKPMAAIKATPGEVISWNKVYDVRQFFGSSAASQTGTITAIEIQNSGTVIGSGTVLNFVGNFLITQNGQTFTIQDVDDYYYSVEDLTSQVTSTGTHYTLSNTAVANTLALYVRGSRQQPWFATLDGNGLGFTLVSGTLQAGDTFVAEYNKRASVTGFVPSHYPLPILAVSGNTNFNTILATAAADYYLQSNGTQNDEVYWDINLPQGTYTWHITHFSGPNRGIYSLLLNGVSVATVDGYAGSGTIVRSSVAAIVTAGGSLVRVKVKMETKNGSSTDYYGLIFDSWLVRTGD